MQKFEPFQRVLYRYSADSQWLPGFYARPSSQHTDRHCIVGDTCTHIVIPYHGNEWLLGKTDAPEDKREYKWGDKIEVNLNGVWEPALYRCKSQYNSGYHSIYLGEGVSTAQSATSRPLQNRFIGSVALTGQ